MQMEDPSIDVFQYTADESDNNEISNLIIEDINENDPLDFGCVDIVDKLVVEGSKNIPNPFYVSIQQPRSVVAKNAYGKMIPIINVKNVLVMIPKSTANSSFDELTSSGTIVPTCFFEKYISSKELEQICAAFSLKRCSIKILNVEVHLKNAVIVPKKLLETIDHEYKIINDESVVMPQLHDIVVPIIDINSDNIDMYISTFGQIVGDYNKLNDVIDIKNYYGSRKPIEFEFIEGIIGDYFWRYDTREFNMTRIFANRRIRINDSELICDPHDVGNTNTMVPNLQARIDADYVACTENRYRTSLSDVLKKSKDRRFYVSKMDTESYMNDRVRIYPGSNEYIDQETITQMFMSLNDNQSIYNFFNAMATSKRHCHLVVNNPQILMRMSNLFKKYDEIYRYVLTYPMLTLYVEECILRNRITRNARCVFTIETAHQLPIYPFTPNHVHASPYNVIQVKQSELVENMYGLEFIKNHYGYGIDTLEGFRRKFNIFTTHRSDTNIFDGIDWSHIVVSGSTISACIPTRSPLVHTCGVAKDAPLDEQYDAFFKKYYGTSDIDVLCATTQIDVFFDETDKLIKQVRKNLKLTDDSQEITVKPIAMSRIFIHDSIVDRYFEDLSKICAEIVEPADVRKILKKCGSGKKAETMTQYRGVIEYFYKIYVDAKNKKYEGVEARNIIHAMYLNRSFDAKHSQDMTLAMFNHFSIQIVSQPRYKNGKSSECIMIESGPVPNKEDGIITDLLCVEDSYRFKVENASPSGPLYRSFEVFRAIGDDPFSTIHAFHLPCVRGFYDGKMVYMTASCVYSHLTYMNLDYKYFAGTQQPLEIVNKYLHRGYGLYMSKHEINSLHTIKIKSDILKQKSIGDVNGTVTDGTPSNIQIVPYVERVPKYSAYDVDGNIKGFNVELCKSAWYSHMER